MQRQILYGTASFGPFWESHYTASFGPFWTQLAEILDPDFDQQILWVDMIFFGMIFLSSIYTDSGHFCSNS